MRPLRRKTGIDCAPVGAYVHSGCYRITPRGKNKGTSPSLCRSGTSGVLGRIAASLLWRGRTESGGTIVLSVKRATLCDCVRQGKITIHWLNASRNFYPVVPSDCADRPHVESRRSRRSVAHPHRAPCRPRADQYPDCRHEADKKSFVVPAHGSAAKIDSRPRRTGPELCRSISSRLSSHRLRICLARKSRQRAGAPPGMSRPRQ